MVWHWILDGEYKCKWRTRGAVSQIMIASLNMRFGLIRGGGVDGDGAEHPVGGDETRIANAHMHFRTAKG